MRAISPFKPRKAWVAIDSPAPAPKIDFHKINSERHKQALAAAPMEREKRISKLPQLGTKPEHAKRSDDKPREVMTCKARPKNNKKHGSGSGKSFVPWCR